MRSFRSKSTSEQLADHLRDEILNGRLTGAMPGIQQLVQTLGVNSAATTKAVRQLEREGLIISQGKRRRRLIATDVKPSKHSLRVTFLHYDAQNELRHDSLLVRQALIDAGHTPIMAPKTMQELGMNPERIARMAESADTDAWIIYAGSADTLQWFADHRLPALAIYGRFNQIAMPAIGIQRQHVDEMLTERLIRLGHRRIVWINRKERRRPKLGSSELRFLEKLESHGIQTGPYNIPDWEESPQGLGICLDRLLQHTPPTAMIICDPVLFHAIQTHLAYRGFKSPDQISLYCDDYAESFDWALPSTAHLRWDHRPVVRRVLQWTKNLRLGKEDLKQTLIKAEFADGDTIGPPPK
ncbi:MAG: substrate-binding domain-containing protein [Akkermansiaceae bacterium]|nr:substrate-binding domain-containing protein [Akkermansiaceae bacterium]